MLQPPGMGKVLNEHVSSLFSTEKVMEGIEFTEMKDKVLKYIDI